MKAIRRALEFIPGSLELLREDVIAIGKNDPAARSYLEVLLVYPGLHALWLHRAAHLLWKGEQQFAARLLSHANRFITGIEIHPGATIGHHVFIDHGMGIVIGETAIIGDGCLLYKGVNLGGTSLSRTKRHPTLGKNVIVGANACILGAIEIGDGARIGSGSVVVRPVPEGATVVGVPARIIVPAKQRFDAALDHANLPDPVSDMLRALATQNERLRDRLNAIEDKLAIAADEQDDDVHLPWSADELPPADGG
ncbi:MAG: serine O-acetyltransferase [Polyangiaceae bacterium]